MLLRIFSIWYLFCTGFLYAADQKTLVDACKKETFHTKKKSSIDHSLEKKLAQLKQEKPHEYNEMLLFAQQKNNYKKLKEDTHKKNT